MASRIENIDLIFNKAENKKVEIPIKFPGVVRINENSVVRIGELISREIVFTNQQLVYDDGDYCENYNKTLHIEIRGAFDIKLDFSKFQISDNINRINVEFKNFEINSVIIAPREINLVVERLINKLLINNFELNPVVEINHGSDVLVDLEVECYNVEYNLNKLYIRDEEFMAESITIGRIGKFLINYSEIVVFKKIVINSESFKAYSNHDFVIGPFVNELMLGSRISKTTKIPVTVRKVCITEFNWQAYIDPMLIDSYEFDEFTVSANSQPTIDAIMGSAGKIIKNVKCLKISALFKVEGIRITDRSTTVNGIKPEILKIKNDIEKLPVHVDLDPQGTINELNFVDFTAPRTNEESVYDYFYRINTDDYENKDQSSISGIGNLKSLKVFGNVRILRYENEAKSGCEISDNDESKIQFEKIVIGGKSPLRTLHLVDNPCIDNRIEYFKNIKFETIEKRGGNYYINVDYITYDKKVAGILSKANNVVIAIRPSYVKITNNEFIQNKRASRHKFLLIDNFRVGKLPIEVIKRLTGADEKKAAVIVASCNASQEMPSEIALLCGSFI
ncbi:MAG: hypothetical protein CMK92_05745 [Pseudomonas sp.]|nr:hypothetical protein [Pseudomonas sp.]|tara:strand:+ start:924 stop:2615 length:1692 start_codon:yes stop_codon:yes gene_type:complete